MGSASKRAAPGRAAMKGSKRVLSQLDQIHSAEPLDAIVITGDLTDAGRSGEWAEIVDAIVRHPVLAERMLIVPGNHDLNVIDRGNPARLDLPTSPKRRLRQVRTLSMVCAIQGQRVHVIDHDKGEVGVTLAEALQPDLARIGRFSDVGRPLLSRWWIDIWCQAFPMIVPPDTDDGLGFILINSNADTHFSFTNALGVVSTEQLDGIEIATRQYPRASWVVALHHHLVEYPWRPHAFSERIGTALINSNWFVRRLRALAGRAVVMHGHRHVDWLGECAGLTIVSAPSPVMDAAPSCFYVHTLVRDSNGHLGLLAPERVVGQNVQNTGMADDALQDAHSLATHSPDSLATHSSDSLATHSSDSLATHSSDSLATHSSDSLATHSSDLPALVDPSRDRIDV